MKIVHHVDAPQRCARCGARVYSYADAATGEHYCRSCVRVIEGSKS